MLDLLQGPLALEPIFEPNSTAFPSKKTKHWEKDEQNIQHLHIARWDQFHPDWHLRIKVPHSVGVKEMDSIQVCILWTHIFLLTLRNFALLPFWSYF